MSFIVYRITNHAANSIFVSKASATRKLNHLNKHGPEAGQWRMTTCADFQDSVVFLREVKNLMTGQMVMERSDTPYYCSVASEAYWSR